MKSRLACTWWRRLGRRCTRRHYKRPREHRHTIWHHRELEAKARYSWRNADGVVVAILSLGLAKAWTRIVAWSNLLGARSLETPFICDHTSADSYGFINSRLLKIEAEDKVPFEETPAPISISGSSTTIPPSMGFPPVPPYSAVNIHLRSASVKRSIGITLMPV